MADFPSTPRCEYPVTETWEKPEVLISRHRDGSEQRRLKGSGMMRGWEISWGSGLLTTAHKDAILSHYLGQNGQLTAFNWTHPETTTVYLVRYDGEPQFTQRFYNSWSGSVRFQRVAA